MRRLFQMAKDGIVILDADTGNVIDANPFMNALLGHSPTSFWDHLEVGSPRQMRNIVRQSKLTDFAELENPIV